LSIVESPQLKSIFYEAEPSYVIPTRKFFINNVLRIMYKEIRERVHVELQQSPGIPMNVPLHF